MFDFDDIHLWGPKLFVHISSMVSLTSAGSIIRARKPEFLEDAAEIFFSDVYQEKARFTASVLAWIKTQTVAAYHGSRLDAADIDGVRQNGLIVLSAERRREYLRKKLSTDSRWCEDKFNAVMKKLDDGQFWGKREGQVHATISRGGLVNGFNHYLKYGSEFDQCVVSLLFGDTGKELLARYGIPVLVRLAIPGEKALAAANPYILDPDGCPNLVREVIRVWTYWLANSTLEVANLKYDCGLIFNHDVLPEWISSVDKIV
ncbi:MAG: hypothetical protein ACYC46_11185 [Acidobacteriaceae bacterium]